MATIRPRNVFIVGAQCTGKTTLLNALRYHFQQAALSDHNLQQPRYISEVARTVMSQLNLNREDIVISAERSLKLQRAILDAQYQAEVVDVDKSIDWYISDRSGIDPIVYALLYVSEKAASDLLVSETWQVLGQNMRDGLVFVCEAGCSWLIDDGVRLMPKNDGEWTRVNFAFQRLLEESDIKYCLISKDMGSLQDRLDLVLRALDRHFL